MKNISVAKKTFKPLLILGLFAVFVISSTIAFFTSTDESEANTFETSNLKIEISQNNLAPLQGWTPGSEQTIEFSMLNTGSMPEHVKGYLSGTWTEEGLDYSIFDISKLERKVNDAWVVVNDTSFNLDEEFYFSTDGTQNNLLELLPNQKEDFRVTVRFYELATDEYQNQTFNAQIHLASKQTNPGADWPASY